MERLSLILSLDFDFNLLLFLFCCAWLQPDGLNLHEFINAMMARLPKEELGDPLEMVTHVS